MPYSRPRPYRNYPRRTGYHRSKDRNPIWGYIGSILLVGALLTAAGVSLWANFGGQVSGCNIKGNISVNTGERIYHVPGGYYYDRTRISPSKGERWFCSEEEARAAGWRKSRR